MLQGASGAIQVDRTQRKVHSDKPTERVLSLRQLAMALFTLRGWNHMSGTCAVLSYRLTGWWGDRQGGDGGEAKPIAAIGHRGEWRPRDVTCASLTFGNGATCGCVFNLVLSPAPYHHRPQLVHPLHPLFICISIIY